MGERFYWWEAVVTIRKCVLTVTTILLSPGTDVSTTADPQHEEHMKANEKGALISLTVVMFAVTMQAWAQPYVDPDVNRAELFALMGNYFVLLVGLGYRTQEGTNGELQGEGSIEGQLVPLISLGVACLAVVLTFPMIWAVKHLIAPDNASEGSADSQGDDLNQRGYSSDRVLHRLVCGKERTLEVSTLKAAALCLLIVAIYLASLVVIAAVGCDKEAQYFYCRTHTQVLDYMNALVYVLVGAAVSYSFWVFIKKFGTLLDSFGMDKSHSLGNDVVDMLHKGMVGTANAWAANPLLPPTDRARAKDIMGKIKQFKLATGVKYDKNFARFFKDEEVYTVYAWLIQAEEDEREALKWFVDELTEKKSERDFKLISCPCSKRIDRLCCLNFRETCKRRNRPKSFFEDLDADATVEASEAETWSELYDLQQQMTDRERFDRFGEVATNSMMELQELKLEGREDNAQTRKQLKLHQKSTGQSLGRSSVSDGDFERKNREMRAQGRGTLTKLGRDTEGALGSKKAKKAKESPLLSLGTKRRSSSQSSADLDTVEESSWAIGGGGEDASSSSWNPFAAGSGWGKYEKEPEPEPEPDLVLGGFSSTEPAAATAKSGLLGALFDRGGRSKAKAAAQQEVEMISVDRFQSPFAAELFGDSGANTSHAFATAEPSKKELKKMAKESEKLAKSAQKSAKKTEQQERKLDKQQEKEERKRVQAKTKGKDNEWGVTHTHTAAEKAKRTSTAAAKEKLKEKKQARSSSSGGGGGGGGGGRASGGGGDPFDSSFGSIGGADEFDDPATSKETKKKKKKKKKKKGDDGDDDWMRTTNIMQSHDRGGF
jgi:hypothetical protein